MCGSTWPCCGHRSCYVYAPAAMTLMKHALLALAVLALATEAAGQDRIIYGKDGRIVGRETTHSNGASAVYGADGRVRERTLTTAAPRRSMTLAVALWAAWRGRNDRPMSALGTVGEHCGRSGEKARRIAGLGVRLVSSGYLSNPRMAPP